jgi:hypothetical protein
MLKKLSRYMAIFLTFVIVLNLSGCGMSESKIEKYLEKKYNEDFVVEEAKYGYFTYYSKKHPDYHYKGLYTSENEIEEAYYYSYACRIVSDYVMDNVFTENNIDGFAYLWATGSTGSKENSNGVDSDISAEDYLKISNWTNFYFYVCFPEEVGNINSETINNYIMEIYNLLSQYNPDIDVRTSVYIFTTEDFPRVKEYFQMSGSPVFSEFQNTTNDFNIVDNKAFNIKNGNILED